MVGRQVYGWASCGMFDAMHADLYWHMTMTDLYFPAVVRYGDQEQGVSMSYQPYPAGGSYQPYPAGGGPAAQQVPQPSSVRTAVWLMYGGAVLSAITAILVLVLGGRIKKAIGKAAVKTNATLIREGKKPLTLSQIHSLETALVGIVVIVLVISVILWVFMAWANGRGKAWARIVASVLFGLNTLYLLLVVSRAGTSVLFVALGWLLGLGAIIMLWRRESSAYFKPAGPM